MHAIDSNLKACPICYEIFDNKIPELLGHIAGKVNHIFHDECIQDWLNANPLYPSCPVCRDSLADRALKRLPNPNLSWYERIIHWKNKGLEQGKAALSLCGRLAKVTGSVAVQSALGYAIVKAASSAIDSLGSGFTSGLAIGAATVITAGTVTGITIAANKALSHLLELEGIYKLQHVLVYMSASFVALMAIDNDRACSLLNAAGIVAGAGSLSGMITLGSFFFMISKCGFSPFGVSNPDLMNDAYAVTEGAYAGAIISGFLSAASVGIYKMDSKILALLLGALGAASAAGAASNFPILLNGAYELKNNIRRIA